MDDAELIRRAQHGNNKALSTLYDRYQPHIFRFVWSRIRHQQTAEDMTGEIFTRMVSRLPQYQDIGLPFRAWLYRIARNLIADYFRKQDEKNQLPLNAAEDIPDIPESLDAIVHQQFTITSIEQALDEIDPEQREVVILRFLVGLPLKEVALSLDKSVPAIKSLQHRGLKALRVAIQQHEVTP